MKVNSKTYLWIARIVAVLNVAYHWTAGKILQAVAFILKWTFWLIAHLKRRKNRDKIVEENSASI